MADNNIGQDVLDLLRASPQTDSRINIIPDLPPPPPPGIERYAREGVPLDTTTGADFGTRAGLSAITNPESRRDYVSRAYGGSKVDVTDTGDLIIRNVQDQRTGKPVDMLVDEKGFSASKDILADFSVPAIRMAAELFFLKKIGLADASVMKRLVLGSTAAAAYGEGLSATYQAILGQNETFGEHLKEAGKTAVAGIALGAPLEAALGGLNVARGRLTGEFIPGDAERSGIRALGEVNREAGTEIIPSFGQMAESPDILNLETFLKRLPFFGTGLRRQDELRNEEIRRLQRAVIGGQPLQPLADMGADLAETVKSVVEQPAQIANVAENSLAQRAASQLEVAITGMAPSARSFTEEGTAALTKLASRSQFGRFQQIADELFAAGGNPDISTGPLRPLLRQIESDLPKRTVITESEVVDAHGAPLATTEGREIVRELVPADLQKFIRGADSLDETMPLNEIRRIRNTVDNAIKEGRGLGDVGTHELQQLRHALTETINRGVEDLGEQGAAILRANRFYRENIERFEVPLIARLLKEHPSDPGYIGNFALINQIRNNPDSFREIEGFLRGAPTESGQAIGASSENVFNVLRRSIMEDIVNRSRVTPGSSLSRMNADAFVKELENYPSAVRSTLLGAREDTINANLALLKQLKEGFKDVPADDLEAFIRYPANSIEDLSRLATANKSVAKAFENEVIGKLLSGKSVDIDQLASEQALDWLLKAKNQGDVATVMQYASERPELVDSIRRNTAARLFQETAQEVKPSDAARLTDPTQLVDPKKFIAKFRDPQSRDRLRLLLGNESFNLLENFAKTQSLFGKTGQGSLSTGTTATKILTRTLDFFKNVPLAAKFTIYSTALTNRSLQRAVMEGSLNPATDLPTWTAALISSPPVLRALSEQYGKSGTELVIQAVKSLLQTSAKPEAQTSGTTNQNAPQINQSGTNSIGEDVLQLLRRN